MSPFVGKFVAAYGTCCLIYLGFALVSGLMTGGALMAFLVFSFISFAYACVSTGRGATEADDLRRRVRELEDELGRSVARVPE